LFTASDFTTNVLPGVEVTHESGDVHVMSPSMSQLPSLVIFSVL